MPAPVGLFLPLYVLAANFPVETNQLAVDREHRLRLGLADAGFQRFQEFGVVWWQAGRFGEVNCVKFPGGPLATWS